MTTGHVKKMMAPSGRYAIMARKDEASSWVQVESILGLENAERFVEELDEFDEPRLEAIEEFEAGDDWGDDAPLEAP